jgi:hypothetical protein
MPDDCSLFGSPVFINRGGTNGKSVADMNSGLSFIKPLKVKNKRKEGTRKETVAKLYAN